ncbi:MAG: AMP-binding protein [Chromatiales bacterium]
MLHTLLRLAGRALCRLLYRVEVRGVENYYRAGPRVLILANHTSLLDGALLYLYLPERPTFAINTAMAQKWYFKPFLKMVRIFPMDPSNALAIKAMVGHVRENRKAVIFPEGRITVTGALMKIYEGPGVIAERAAAALLAVGIEGAQYTPFSYLHQLVRRRWFPKIILTVLPPASLKFPDHLTGHARRKAAARVVGDLMLRVAYANCFRDNTVFDALLQAMATHGANHVIAEDPRRQSVTYRQLVTRAFILGKAISAATAEGEHVGVLLPNSTAVLTVFMALHSCGRVPAMLNSTSGSLGVIAALETASIHIVYTSHQFVERAGLGELVRAVEVKAKVVYLEDAGARLSLIDKLEGALAARLPRWAYRRRRRLRNPDAAAVILFTSGSEGIPKGVVLSHTNLLANRAQTHTLIGLHRRDIVFNALPVFHSFGLTAGTLLPLLAGAKIFFYPTPLHHRIIPELCYELGATVLFGTNTFLSAYARSAHPFDFYRMRYVVAGSEKLQGDTRRVWAEQFGIRVLEGYGATEASPVVSVNTPMGNRPGTVGRLLTGIEYYLEPVEGMMNGGKLIIRGPNVMKGYLYHGSDGEIVPPVTTRGPGWYDTGDVVEVDQDGYIRIVGRAKRFAKVGGEMISLTAVEEIAARVWPKGHHAAVTVADARRGEMIILVTDSKQADRRQMLEGARALGASELHVPRRVLVVEGLPLLGSGKVDYRRALEVAKQLAQE